MTKRTTWVVTNHDEFDSEFNDLPEDVQDEILALAELLAEKGPSLGRPHVDTLNGSKHANLKELRFYVDNGAWRVAFAFDTERKGILLVAGDKSGQSEKKFYRALIAKADTRFDQHLGILKATRTEKKRGKKSK